MKTYLLNNKFFFILSLTLILSILFSGCSSQSKDIAIEESYSDVEAPAEEASEDDYFFEDSYKEDSNDSFEANMEKPLISSESSNSERKLIKNGYLELRTNDVDLSYDNVADLVSKYKGFETNLNRSQSDSFISIHVEFGIPAQELDTFLEEVSEKEDVDYLDITSEDITNAYYDSTIRLETSEQALEKYYDFLKDAQDIEDMVYIQGEIDRLTENIEVLKGQLKLWDSQVDYSYVSISFLEYQDKVPTNREVTFKSMSWDDFKYLVNSGWARVLSGIVSTFQWIFIAILVAAPIVIPLLIVVLFVIFMVKRKKKKKEKIEENINKDEHL